MVFSRGLVISLGVSALSATLLFLYFRNRMASVERKVDVMFDLIQSHESDRQQAQMMMMQQRQPQMMMGGMSNGMGGGMNPQMQQMQQMRMGMGVTPPIQVRNNLEVSSNSQDLHMISCLCIVCLFSK